MFSSGWVERFVNVWNDSLEPILRTLADFLHVPEENRRIFYLGTILIILALVNMASDKYFLTRTNKDPDSVEIKKILKRHEHTMKKVDLILGVAGILLIATSYIFPKL